jgi:hypothetical protein
MTSVALAYGQVNDSFAGSFQAIKAHRGRLKKRSAGLLCVQCSPTGGDGEPAKTLPTGKQLNQNRPLNPLSIESQPSTPST